MLAALWGGSFLFMRICAPSVGPTLLILLRVGLAALFLLCVARLMRRGLPLRGRLRHYAVVGVFNSAIPFSLFAAAAIDLPASLLSILNATAPIWAAIISAVLAQGSVIHPTSYRKEFRTGASVAWSRVPWTLGCCARWNEETRKEHYQTLVAMDRRIVLAGEHASYVGCWMEGALLSSLDAITRLHKRALSA